MDKSTKIFIGAAVTTLMAWGAHSGLGTGTGFVERLEARASTTLADGDFDGVEMAMESDPITRTITLSGDESKKDAAIAAMKAVPGVGLVKWAGDEDAEAAAEGGDAEEETPASAEAVASCQGNINELMSGKTINFKSGSAYMAAESTAIVAEIGAALKPCAGTSVEVQGHTDLTGGAEVNKTLSQSRADTVKAELVKLGVPEGRLSAKGYGSDQPLENARTSAANAKNRRTVFVVSAAGASAANEGE